MATKILEEYPKQLFDWQKKFYETWMTSLPNGTPSFNFSENLEQTLKFQEELVKSYLEVQEKTSKMLLDAQKQFWADYFEMLRKQPVIAAN